MEKDFRNDMEKFLADHFEVRSEIKGTHFSGKRLSIDNIIIPKSKALWKNKEIAFGIEYKDMKRLDGDTKNFTSWLAQCVDYANTYWDEFGYIYILTCPEILSTTFIKKVDESWMLNRVMSQLGIGELKYIENYGHTITLQDSHRIWSEKNGVEAGKKWSLKRKFGSR